MNAEKLLSRLIDNPVAGAAATGILGGLAGRALGRRRGMGLGGLALLGGLAWMAYRKFTEKSEGTLVPPEPEATTTVVTGSSGAPRSAKYLGELEAPPAGSAFLPAEGDAAREELGLLLVRAMIAVAKADGELDFEESTHIFGKVSDLELEDDERAFLQQEISAPLDVEAIASAAATPEHRAEVYAASVLVAADRNDAEREYLEELRGRLGLDEALAREIEATVTAT